MTKSVVKWNQPKAPNEVLTLQVIISLKQESQRDCELLRKPVHMLCMTSVPKTIRVQALLKSVADIPLQKVTSSNIQILINTLKLKKACGLEGIKNERLRHVPRRSLSHVIHLFNYCLQLSYFP
jgi:hypothetical protein